jgi:hypothetical protein
MGRARQLQEDLENIARAFASGRATIFELTGVALQYAQQVYRNRKSRERNKCKKAREKSVAS